MTFWPLTTSFSVRSDFSEMGCIKSKERNKLMRTTSVLNSYEVPKCLYRSKKSSIKTTSVLNSCFGFKSKKSTTKYDTYNRMRSSGGFGVYYNKQISVINISPTMK